MAAKKTGKNLIKWEEQLAQYAEEGAQGEERGPGQMVTVRGGVMMFQGAAIDDNELSAVIIDHIKVNAFYGGEFDPDNPQPPLCYAYGRGKDDMAPHEEATEPQSDSCETCPHNEWGSAEKGRGKACKNTRRLALIATDSLEDIEEAPVAFMHLPVTSVAAWSQYVNKLQDTLHRPTFAFVTEIKVVPDPKTQFRIGFKATEQFDDAATFEQLVAKKEDVASHITFAYSKVQESEAPKGRGGRNAAKNRVRGGGERKARNQREQDEQRPQRQQRAAKAPAAKGGIIARGGTGLVGKAKAKKAPAGGRGKY